MVVKGKNGIEAEVVLGTKSNVIEAPPIYTIRIKFHRYVAEQLLKHRMFSCCANSSRAMTVPKMNANINEGMAMPIFWGAQQKGMQPSQEHNQHLTGDYDMYDLMTTFCASNGVGVSAEQAWEEVGNFAMTYAHAMWDAGYHQQIPNRLTHPFQMAEYIITATDFENFFNLRLKDCNAQAEINELARCMKEAISGYIPKPAQEGWHLPYITNDDLFVHGVDNCLRLSAARCAVISYNNHRTGKPMEMEAANRIYTHLLEDSNPHYTPLEMQARVLTKEEYKMVISTQQDLVYNYLGKIPTGMLKKKVKQQQYFGNLNYWISQRTQKESERL